MVFVVAGDLVERRAVSVERAGGAGSGQVAVLSGLSAGERVVIEGPDDLAHGDSVRAR